MWKTIALLFIGCFVGSFIGGYIQSMILKPFIGDDFEINKPKVKGENNILHVFQSNKKQATPENKEEKKKRRFSRKRKQK